MAARPVIDNMDWLSINTACFGVSNAIAKTSAAINRFVREVRESRSDFDIISSELHSLDGVVELLKDDASSFPPQLATKTPVVLDTCLAILNELEGCISVLDRTGVTRADKKSRWLASRDHIGKLRWTLAGYKSTLGLAVDLVALSRPRKIVNTYHDRILPESDADRKYETTKVVDEIADLTARLEGEARQNGAVARLRQYLDALHIHAITATHVELNHLQDRRRAPSSASDAPDSAVELSDDPSSPISIKQPRVLGSPTLAAPIEEADESLDRLGEMPREVPVPPPRSARRTPSISIPHERHPSNTSDNGSYSVSIIASGGRAPGQNNAHNSWQRVSHMRSWSFSPSDTQDSIYEGHSTPPTDISGQSDRRSNSLEKNRPDSETISQPFDFSRFSRWENPRAQVPIPGMARPSTSSSSMTSQSGQPGVVRRSSSRLSSALRGLRITRKSSNKASEHMQPDHVFEPQIPEARAVFGVPLVESLQVAKGISDDGCGSSESRNPNKTRGYPLCILRCVYFINDQGVDTPHIFGQDADHILLANLREVFSSIDTGYGKILDWDCFTIHEACNLILLFLAELPTPLVPKAAAKRWISLSRQATLSGSLALRLDQGIDFWEEAFLGIHGPSRALLRLLLNLWGDIADQAESNDMTAERLAGQVMRPLMHLPTARYDTDLMLGLAFMIRKRSEYRVRARGVGRKSNAAF